jgi:hypothetical protein
VFEQWESEPELVTKEGSRWLTDDNAAKAAVGVAKSIK